MLNDLILLAATMDKIAGINYVLFIHIIIIYISFTIIVCNNTSSR